MMRAEHHPHHHLDANATIKTSYMCCVHVLLTAAGMASSVHGARHERSAEVGVL